VILFVETGGCFRLLEWRKRGEGRGGRPLEVLDPVDASVPSEVVHDVGRFVPPSLGCEIGMKQGLDGLHREGTGHPFFDDGEAAVADLNNRILHMILGQVLNHLGLIFVPDLAGPQTLL